MGAIPIGGTAAIELFTQIVAPPLEKRRMEWMNDVGERLTELESQGTINYS